LDARGVRAGVLFPARAGEGAFHAVLAGEAAIFAAYFFTELPYASYADAAPPLRESPSCLVEAVDRPKKPVTGVKRDSRRFPLTVIRRRA